MIKEKAEAYKKDLDEAQRKTCEYMYNELSSKHNTVVRLLTKLHDRYKKIEDAFTAFEKLDSEEKSKAEELDKLLKTWNDEKFKLSDDAEILIHKTQSDSDTASSTTLFPVADTNDPCDDVSSPFSDCVYHSFKKLSTFGKSAFVSPFTWSGWSKLYKSAWPLKVDDTILLKHPELASKSFDETKKQKEEVENTIKDLKWIDEQDMGLNREWEPIFSECIVHKTAQ